MRILITIIAICTVSVLTGCSVQFGQMPDGARVANINVLNKKRAENFSATPVVNGSGVVGYAISSTSVGMDNVSGVGIVSGAYALAEQAKQVTAQKVIEMNGTRYLADAKVREAAVNAVPVLVPEGVTPSYSPAVR